MSFLFGTTLLAVVAALACALPGAFIVLRKNSMLVEGMSHAVLPGIVVGYLFASDLDSPLLLGGAALAGLLVVLGSEWLTRTGLLTGDAPQALIFPALFSVGVILVSQRFSNVHLDTQVVLVGDLNLAAFEQLVVGGVSLGPRYLYVMLGVLALNVAFLTAFYPKLKVATFDPQFAASLAIPTRLLNTAFMFLVALTVTAAFHAAGAILVVALMIVPPATAFLLSRRLSVMLGLTAVIAVGGALAGFWGAYVLNAATSAGMSVFYGVLFLLAMAYVRVASRSRSRARTVIRIPEQEPASRGESVDATTVSCPSGPASCGEPQERPGASTRAEVGLAPR